MPALPARSAAALNLKAAFKLYFSTEIFWRRFDSRFLGSHVKRDWALGTRSQIFRRLEGTEGAKSEETTNRRRSDE